MSFDSENVLKILDTCSKLHRFPIEVKPDRGSVFALIENKNSAKQQFLKKNTVQLDKLPEQWNAPVKQINTW